MPADLSTNALLTLIQQMLNIQGDESSECTWCLLEGGHEPDCPGELARECIDLEERLKRLARRPNMVQDPSPNGRHPSEDAEFNVQPGDGVADHSETNRDVHLPGKGVTRAVEAVEAFKLWKEKYNRLDATDQKEYADLISGWRTDEYLDKYHSTNVDYAEVEERVLAEEKRPVDFINHWPGRSYVRSDQSSEDGLSSNG